MEGNRTTAELISELERLEKLLHELVPRITAVLSESEAAEPEAAELRRLLSQRLLSRRLLPSRRLPS